MPISKNDPKNSRPTRSTRTCCSQTFLEFLVVVQFLLNMAGFAAVLYYMDTRLQNECKMLDQRSTHYYTQMNDKVNQLKETIEKTKPPLPLKESELRTFTRGTVVEMIDESMDLETNDETISSLETEEDSSETNDSTNDEPETENPYEKLKQSSRLSAGGNQFGNKYLPRKPVQNRQPVMLSEDGEPKRGGSSTKLTSSLRPSMGKRSVRMAPQISQNIFSKCERGCEVMGNTTTGIPAIHLQAYCSPDMKCSTNKTKYPHKTYVHWKPDPWYRNNGIENDIKFVNTTGQITVIKDGIYFVYAQLMYYTLKSADGYYLYKNDQPILECIVSTEGNKSRSCTCFTGGIMQLNNGDLLKIEAPEKEHIVYLEATKSYWGMFKLGGS